MNRQPPKIKIQVLRCFLINLLVHCNGSLFTLYLESVLPPLYRLSGILIMPIEKHSLVHEFPEMHDRIYTLKTTDNDFARLFDQYEVVEHTVHRIEVGTDAASDERLEQLKKERLSLKDELFGLLNKAD
jgi:uncharacterized protein